MKIRHQLTGLVGLFFLFCQISLAQGSPIPMLQSTADRVIAELSQHKATLKTNPGIVYSIVNRIVLPRVDVEIMSRSVVRPDVWEKASSQERQRFTRAFTTVVIKTYSGALAKFENQTVKFSPNLVSNGDSRVRVNSQILRPGAPPINMTYSLFSRNGAWKVYDMSVEGVSLLQNFRSQFSSKLSSGDFAALINELENRNQRG